MTTIADWIERVSDERHIWFTGDFSINDNHVYGGVELIDEISQLVLVGNLTDNVSAPIAGEQQRHKIAGVGIVFDNQNLDVFSHDFFLMSGDVIVVSSSK